MRGSSQIKPEGECRGDFRRGEAPVTQRCPAGDKGVDGEGLKMQSRHGVTHAGADFLADAGG